MTPDILEYWDFIIELSAEDIRQAALDYLSEEHYTQIILYPGNWDD